MRRRPLEDYALDLSLESPDLPQWNAKQSLILNQTAVVVHETVILQADFIGTNGSDIVSAYSPEKGGAFTYAFGTAQLDGSGHAKVVTGSGKFGAYQEAGVADIPDEAYIKGAFANLAGGTSFGMMLRWIDANNFIFIRVSANFLNIREVFGGTVSTLFNGGSGIVQIPNQTVEVKVSAIGSTVGVAVQGIIGSATVQNTTGTKFGPYCEFFSPGLNVPLLSNWVLG